MTAATHGGGGPYRYPATGEPTHLELRLGDTTIAISAADVLADYGLPPATRGEPFELAVRVSDVDKAFAVLLDAGAAALQEPRVAPNGQRVAYVTDPDGNRIHLWA